MTSSYEQNAKVLPHSLTGAWRRIVSWFRDDVFRRLFLNAGKLLSAHTIAAGLSFVLTALTARALGPENYGYLALVLTYEQTIGKLVSSDAWQAVIKFGSERLQADDRNGLCQLVKFSFGLDLGGAIVGMLLALALSGPTIALLGWDEALRPSLMLYSVLILFTLGGTPTGVLRLFDRFDLIGYASVFGVAVRLVGVSWCLLTEQGIGGFVWVYLITGILGQLYRLVAAWWVLRRQGVGNFLAQPFRGLLQTFPGIWRYVIATNVNATVRMLSYEADGLIIAMLTTPAALGLFKVAKQFARVLPLLLNPLNQSIYPELARFWAQGRKRRFASLIKRTSLLVSGTALSMWIGFILFGNLLISWTVGPAYRDAYWVTVIYMLAVILAFSGFALAPAVLAIGKPHYDSRALLISTAVYFALLFPLVRWLGVVGASIAYVAFYAIWCMLMVSCLLPYVRPIGADA